VRRPEPEEQLVRPSWAHLPKRPRRRERLRQRFLDDLWILALAAAFALFSAWSFYVYLTT
jgi:type VI protein secretion system component VasF